MVSKVDICNRGLIKVDAELITSLDQGTKEAILCNALFDQVRDEVLRAHFWNFAIKQASLQKLVDTPLFDFQNKYQLPSDYIRIYRLQESRNRYKIKGDELHTNSTTVNIEYVSRVEDTTQYDPMFVNCFGVRMGAEVAYAIAGSDSRGQMLMAEYNQLLKEAKRADGQEGTPDSLTADLFVDSRHEYGGSYPIDWTN